MSRSPFHSMRSRMTGGFAFFMSLVVAIGILTLVFLLQYIAQTRAVTRVDMAYVAAQATLLQHSQENPGPISLVNMMREHQSEITYIDVVMLVVNEKNQVLWKSQKDSFEWPTPSAEWRWRSLEVNDEKLVIGVPWRVAQLEFKERALALGLFGVMVVIGTALGAWWVVGRTLFPISALARQVEQASREDLRVRLTPPSQDAEMVELVNTFNRLLKHLGDEAEMRSRFYAIASHELRTPLQALSGHLELALSRDRSNEVYKGALQESLNHTHRLISLVQALLQLYQIETKKQPQQVLVNLRSILDEQLAQLQPWIERRELTADCHLEHLHCNAPPGHFDIVVRNLLENAVKYSCAGCTIMIALRQEGTKVLLQISNQYDPTQDSPAATMTDVGTQMDSHGLGMTICKAIINANDWQMQVLQQSTEMTVSVWLKTLKKSCATIF